jgi:hypothetical protein
VLNSKKRKAYEAGARVMDLAKRYPDQRIFGSVVQYPNFKWRVQVWCGVSPVAVLTPNQVDVWVDTFAGNKALHDYKVHMLQLSPVPHAG